jgi:hypothetical protein
MRVAKIMSNAKRKWHCPSCSQDSSRHWNLEMHIKRKHNGIGEPINEEEYKEFNDKRSNQFFSHRSLNDLSLESLKGKEKERDVIDECYQIVMEHKEKLRKIMEIKSFYNELSSFSSSQQPTIIISGPGQTPIIDTTIPPVTTTPLQPTPTASASSLPKEEHKEENINPGTALIVNLFITSTLVAQDPQRRTSGAEGEDFIIIPREPSLPPSITTSLDDNNNDSKKIREANPTIENSKEGEKLEECRHDIEEHPLSKTNLLVDDDYYYDDEIDYVYFFGKTRIIKGDIYGNVLSICKLVTNPLLEAKYIV